MPRKYAGRHVCGLILLVAFAVGGVLLHPSEAVPALGVGAADTATTNSHGYDLSASRVVGMAISPDMRGDSLWRFGSLLDAGVKARAADLSRFAGSVAPNAIAPSEIRLSQATVNGPKVAQIADDMRVNGWQGDPVDVVRMPDGRLTSFDNKRIVAANEAGIDVQARVHGFDDAFPSGRLPGKGEPPGTWGEAVSQRIANQKSGWRNCYPMGGPTCLMGEMP